MASSDLSAQACRMHGVGEITAALLFIRACAPKGNLPVHRQGRVVQKRRGKEQDPRGLCGWARLFRGAARFHRCPWSRDGHEHRGAVDSRTLWRARPI